MKPFRIKEYRSGYIIQCRINFLIFQIWYSFRIRNLQSLGGSDLFIHRSVFIFNSVEEAVTAANLWVPQKNWTYKGFTIKAIALSRSVMDKGYYIADDVRHHQHVNMFSTYVYSLLECSCIIDERIELRQRNKKSKVVLTKFH